MAKAKHDTLEKDRLLQEKFANQKSLTQQLRSTNNSLVDAKHIIWDHLLKESKMLKDYFIQVEDEKQLATSCLDNMLTLHKNLVIILFRLKILLNFSIQGQRPSCILQELKIEQI